MSFEILTTTRDQERLALAFVRNLKRAGIEARVRTVDATQFERRRIAFDFDMMEYRWEQSLSPGNEQLFYWGSAAADQQGSRARSTSRSVLSFLLRIVANFVESKPTSVTMPSSSPICTYSPTRSARE